MGFDSELPITGRCFPTAFRTLRRYWFESQRAKPLDSLVPAPSEVTVNNACVDEEQGFLSILAVNQPVGMNHEEGELHADVVHEQRDGVILAEHVVDKRPLHLSDVRPLRKSECVIDRSERVQIRERRTHEGISGDAEVHYKAKHR